ncbi:MAG: PHP domain-containing protein, partial [Hyphomicrobiaceae bacterium]|nr:PHP domain-containing protein [Hyphomicrobiaceae bacterium]
MNAPLSKLENTETAQPAFVTPAYVHLRVRSAYSLLEGALPISKLAKLTAKNKFPAVGLTDTNNLFGILEFSNKLADAGIQPIAGITLSVDFGDRVVEGPVAALPQRAEASGSIALFAMNETGYASLMKLASQAFFDVAESEPAHVKFERLVAHNAGLIALTGGSDGPVDRALKDGQSALAQGRLDRLSDVFGDRLYVEIQRHGEPHERTVEAQLLDMAYAADVPIVATNGCYFAEPGDYDAHDALLCIAGGNYVVEDDRRRLTRNHYFKSAEDMTALFADLPEALANTVEIAKRCAFRPLGRKPILPRFVSAGDGASAEEQLLAEAEELRRQAREGLARRLDVIPLADGFTREDYEKRLEFELDIIVRMKFPGYFLI